MTGFIAWLCHSPRRLAVGGATILVVLLVAGTALFGNGTGARVSDGGAAGAAGPGPVASSAAQVPDAGPYVTAALGFVRLWSQVKPGETATEWHAALVPLTTPDLGRALGTTDPTDLPGVAPAGDPVVRYVAQTSALVAVPLADSTSVLVSVVMNGQAALISDIQPNLGDT
jgi:hypothetical protein